MQARNHITNQNKLPSFADVSKLLRLDEATGRLFWVSPPSNRVRAGSEAGSTRPDGARKVTILGIGILSHRVVWLLHTGAWPINEVDHINGARSDNRPSNLRDVSTSQNQQNKKTARIDNKSASRVPGCFWSDAKKRWMAVCRTDGKRVLNREFMSRDAAENCVLEFRSKNFQTNTLPSCVSEFYGAGRSNG